MLGSLTRGVSSQGRSIQFSAFFELLCAALDGQVKPEGEVRRHGLIFPFHWDSNKDHTLL